jgi:hypothetical protein
MDPRDPKFQLLAGMMSGRSREPIKPGCGCAVIAAIALLAACIVFAGLTVH